MSPDLDALAYCAAEAPADWSHPVAQLALAAWKCGAVPLERFLWALVMVDSGNLGFAECLRAAAGAG